MNRTNRGLSKKEEEDEEEEEEAAAAKIERILLRFFSGPEE